MKSDKVLRSERKTIKENKSGDPPSLAYRKRISGHVKYDREKDVHDNTLI